MDIIRENGRAELSEAIKKQEEYALYIAKHVELVKKVFFELFYNKHFNLTGYEEHEVNYAIRRVSEEVANHDDSKWSDEEFGQYRNKWHPTKAEQEQMESDESYKELVYEKYKKAWKHHYTVNDHHPDHWVKNNVPVDMPLYAIIHMISDWEAMSRAKGGTTVEWWNTKAEDERKAMTDKTKATVDEILSILFSE